MNNTYALFLDDERFPKNVTWIDYPISDGNWTIVRNYKEFVDIIMKKGIPKTFLILI